MHINEILNLVDYKISLVCDLPSSQFINPIENIKFWNFTNIDGQAMGTFLSNT